MQSPIKTDRVYCLRILEAIGKIDLYSSGYNDPYVFFDANDQRDFNACLLLMLHIGEQVNQIGNTLKVKYPRIPWQATKGFRNLIAHDYVGVDRLIVFETIRLRLPDLKQSIELIIQTKMQQRNFDKIDCDLSK